MFEQKYILVVICIKTIQKIYNMLNKSRRNENILVFNNYTIID